MIRYVGLLLLATIAHAGVIPSESEGKVQFYNVADSDFDPYSRAPSLADQAWMRSHYARMQTYSTYFDTRVAWYPNAWFYKDSYAIYVNQPIPNVDWILKDAAGRKLFIQWGCGNGTCPQYAADVGNPAFRANWIAEAKATMSKGYKGIWVDDVNLSWRISDGSGALVTPINPRTGTLMTLNEWQSDFATFMEEVRAALPNKEVTHNSIWVADTFTDPQVLRQIDAADYINLERGANDQGLSAGAGTFSFERWLSFIDTVHARGKGVVLLDYNGDATMVSAPVASLQNREFGLAAWFLISSGIDLMSTNQLAWKTPVTWWGGYDTNLGKALGPRYTQNALLRRDFVCGYVLVNPPGGSTTHVTFASRDRRLDGTAGGAIDLLARSAVIVEHECATRPLPPTNFVGN